MSSMSSNTLHSTGYSSFSTSFFRSLLPDLFVDQDTISSDFIGKMVSITDLIQAFQKHPECTFSILQNANNMDVIGVMHTNCYYCQISNDDYQRSQLIVCNSQDKSMVILTENEQHQLVERIVCNPNNHTILDLDRMGKRWEGVVIDSVPCGYGIEYDERDEIVREGFVFQEQLVCWGYENYPSSDKIKYCGQYFSGIRFGYGVMYDLQKVVEYEGQWQFDQPITVRDEKSSLPHLDITTSRVELMDPSSISLQNFCLSSFFLNLTCILLNPNNVNSLTNFTLENLPALKQVAVMYDDEKCRKKCISSPYKLPKYPFKVPPPEFCGTGTLMMAHRHEEERKK